MAQIPSVADLIRVMRADAIPRSEAGLWYIERVDEGQIANVGVREYLRVRGQYDRYPTLPHTVTSLCRWTEATLYTAHGECVMSDDPRELQRHLPIVLGASGRVLVTGLGLGCVLRGLLANRAVTHIDVIEIDRDVLGMVAPSFAGVPPLAIHHGDALTYDWPAGMRWDYCWHDVWGDDDSTQMLHAELLARYRSRAPRQGAWMLPRFLKRQWPWPLIGAADRPRRHEAAA